MSGAPSVVPLVVLESGLGAGGRSWAGVARRLAPFATVVAYDRAGYGGSDPAAGDRRTLVQLRDDLVDLVVAVDHDAIGGSAASRPLVLVGHSWGGPIVRAAAAALRDRGRPVAGLVLVDPSDEHADVYFGDAARRIDDAQRRLMVPLARLGALRPLQWAALRGVPRDARRLAARDASTVDAARAVSAETAAFIDDLAALRDAPPDLGDVPVRILSGVRATRPERIFRASLRDAHRASAAAAVTTPLGDVRVIDATRSGHLVPFTEPQLVADTVLELARAARAAHPARAVPACGAARAEHP